MAVETETTDTPESVDIAGAVALMANLSNDAPENADAALPSGESQETPDTEADVGSARDEVADGQRADGEQAGDEEGEAEAAPGEDAPEFWSAEDKACWEQVPPEARPLIKKYEQQRIAFVNEKTREAALAREEAMRVAQSAAGMVEQAAAWWQQNGPLMQQAFADKWSQVDWNKLAQDNPAEWTRLKQQRDNEATLLVEANRRGQADIQVAHRRAAVAFDEARRTEHVKVAAELPEFFGTPEKAKDTYGRLGDYLFSQGIPADRINAIHEAPIIKLALKAWRFDQAQKQASTVTGHQPGAANTTAKTTPTRVAPGPANRAGNRNADAARQVGERFRKSGGASIADAAELIRLSGL